MNFIQSVSISSDGTRVLVEYKDGTNVFVNYAFAEWDYLTRTVEGTKWLPLTEA